MSDLKQDCTCLSTERDPLRHEPDCQHRANELAALRARHEKLLNLPRWVHMKHNPNFEHPNGDWVRYADIRAALEDE